MHCVEHARHDHARRGNAQRGRAWLGTVVGVRGVTFTVSQRFIMFLHFKDGHNR